MRQSNVDTGDINLIGHSESAVNDSTELRNQLEAMKEEINELNDYKNLFNIIVFAALGISLIAPMVSIMKRK